MQKVERDITLALQQYAGTEVPRLIHSFCSARIETLREENDTATEDEFRKKQGGISELKRVCKILETKREFKQYDGSFDQ